MNIFDIIIPVLFILIILKELRYKKILIIPTRKRYGEIIVVLFSIIIFIWIIYSYAKTWNHYTIGVLGILALISGWIKEGISSKGFISMYKYKKIILWEEIEKVTIIGAKDIKVKLFGGFMEQTFHFKKSDYDKVINMLKENLTIKAEIETMVK
ncbi:hypothetical protein KQI86_08625 [Clostridium sp. MSJ-11]|uniref:DUF5673 domain-containing protein n=1 Tax=Clostridium mobile TaxID=2841512 RepID=A0ABS6EIX4_9CLOT|nr:hypothetical protein [Clostridium mobile]MBU5484390.1 hypothetical protein [Clostridium mobile]